MNIIIILKQMKKSINVYPCFSLKEEDTQFHLTVEMKD